MLGQNPLKKLALLLEKEEKNIEAIDKYIEVLHSNPGDKEVYIRLGRLYEKLHKYNQAFEMYSSSLNIDPDYGEGLEAIASLIKKHSIDINTDFFEKIASKSISGKQKALLYFILSYMYDKYGEPDRFEKNFLLDYKCYNYLAGEYEKLSNINKAIRYYKASIKQKKQKHIEEKLIELQETMNDWENTITSMEDLMKNFYLGKEEKVKILLKQAHIYIEKLQKKDRAVEKLKEIFSIDKNNIDAKNMLFYITYEKNEDLEKGFMDLIEASPLNYKVYNFIAKVMMEKNMKEQYGYGMDISIMLNNRQKSIKSEMENSIYIKKENDFNNAVISEKEKDEKAILTYMKPLMEQFYSHEIDKEILLDSSPIGENSPLWADVYDIIKICCERLLTDIPRSYIYNGDKAFRIIMNKDNNDSPFIIINGNFIKGLSEGEKKFILGQAICHIKKDNIIYKQLSENIPVLLANYIIRSMVNRIPLPVPKKLENFFKKIPVNKFLENMKNDKLSSFILDNYKKIKKEPDKKNIIENMMEGIEETSDRCGFICCGNIKSATKGLIKSIYDKIFDEEEIKKLLDENINLQKRVVRLWKFSLDKDIRKLLISSPNQ